MNQLSQVVKNDRCALFMEDINGIVTLLAHKGFPEDAPIQKLKYSAGGTNIYHAIAKQSEYGLFNILLTRIQNFLGSIALSTEQIIGIGSLFTWLAATIGPVSWRQDPTWAFVSVLISNIWLGIPFMAVIILGGLQSISQEYYEAAEIDGANKLQMFRNITLPLIQPVLTPPIVLGVVWTFNKFDVIYLITQGGPQEKTDILVSSMYKAAFQFYRYGFTAMFALIIFAILLVFTIIYLRVSGGLKSATEA